MLAEELGLPELLLNPTKGEDVLCVRWDDFGQVGFLAVKCESGKTSSYWKTLPRWAFLEALRLKVPFGELAQTTFWYDKKEGDQPTDFEGALKDHSSWVQFLFGAGGRQKLNMGPDSIESVRKAIGEGGPG